jgi:hypothetical protein
MHQEEMLHFRYLLTVEGGLLHTAADLPGHFAQLADALAGGGVRDERNKRFLGAFVRPGGLDVPATPAFVDALEQVQRAGTGPDRSLERDAWVRPIVVAAASWSRTGPGRWLMNDLRTDARDGHAEATERSLQARRSAKEGRIREKVRRKELRRRRDAWMLRGKEAKSALRAMRFRTAMFAHRILALAGIGRDDFTSGEKH